MGRRSTHRFGSASTRGGLLEPTGECGMAIFDGHAAAELAKQLGGYLGSPSYQHKANGH